MSLAAIDSIVRATLYEGYVLYPYRASSIKNRHRFTFGTLYPEAWCARNEGDASFMRTECIAHAASHAELDVTVRFLQLVEKHEAGEVRQQAVERTIAVGSGALSRARSHSFELDAISGTIDVSAEHLGDELHRVRVVIQNRTNAIATDRDAALLRSFVSTHTLIGLKNGDFVSSFDPPAEVRALVDGCKNVGAWPVLVGSDGARDAMLSSPVILHDYPSIAPESPGDLFDGTEIDEILTLRVLTLTDDEKEEAKHTDPRARALLERTEALSPTDLARLHGALRTKRRCGPGDRVRLRPKPGGDVFDLALAGKTATIQSVEQDFDGRTFFAVTVDDDPGNDLGVSGQPGHRFFFRPEEVELLA